jgi:hypothetical protein
VTVADQVGRDRAADRPGTDDREVHAAEQTPLAAAPTSRADQLSLFNIEVIYDCDTSIYGSLTHHGAAGGPPCADHTS